MEIWPNVMPKKAKNTSFAQKNTRLTLIHHYTVHASIFPPIFRGHPQLNEREQTRVALLLRTWKHQKSRILIGRPDASSSRNFFANFDVICRKTMTFLVGNLALWRTFRVHQTWDSVLLTRSNRIKLIWQKSNCKKSTCGALATVTVRDMAGAISILR